MADKLAELKVALEGISDEGLRVVLEFAKFLVKKQSGKEVRDANKGYIGN